ncbi:MAG TPA: aminotransferase class IV [Acidimicrobiales bacterium]|nr:aminotransferase class IV [Acidimicrobiales bacterium]
MKVWAGGGLCDESEARVSLLDHGITVGDAVFETVAVRGGIALSLTRHLARMVRSCHGLGIPAPDVAELRQAAMDVVAANSFDEGVLRVIHTSGPGPLGSQRGDRQPTTAILAGPARHWDDTAEVAVVAWPRNERAATAGLKTTSYADNVIALAEARRRGCSEAIFANTAGALCEGSGTNIFLGLDGVLVTPPLSSGCLAGVSRGLLIERCGLEVEERDLPVSVLSHCEEAFLTSATRDVQPIRAVDGRVLPACPGPLTRGAAEAYRLLQEREPDPGL